MEVSNEVHALAALPQANVTQVQIGKELGWAPEPAWTQWKTENLLSLPEIQLGYVGCLGCTYTD
jgi:hypothetical protein